MQTQYKLLIAIFLTIALCSTSVIAVDTLAKTHNKKHQSNTNTGNNTVNQTTTKPPVTNVTNQVNPLFSTGLKTICFNGVVVQNSVSTPSVICEALTIQKTK